MALEDVYQRNLHHRTHRAGWLRAAVLGANDGLVSTASLMIGVAAARAGDQSFLVTAGAAGIAAGEGVPRMVLKKSLALGSRTMTSLFLAKLALYASRLR